MSNMSKLSSIRILKLYRNIYRFNQEYEYELKFLDIDDVWLRIISLPRGQLYYLLDQILVTLIIQNQSLKINGIKIKQLLDYFTKYQIKIALQIKSELLAMPENFLIQYSKTELYNVLLSYLYSNKNAALLPRIKLMFIPEKIQYNSELNIDKATSEYKILQNYFKQLSIDMLDSLVLECANYCVYNTVHLNN